ncbi:sugar kinase [Nesterenkonia sp. F]|uniref:sugar kinase n=1 Tax=Nesterenkonia sp. F TaxID=795955 RepID=UPI000255D15C|nr:sugar kinase [Nesterenkonia sp. F]
MTDAICLGEAMAMVTPPPGECLADCDALSLSIGGAEANVALGLSSLGVSTAWASRLGDDAFGERIRRTLQDGGVDGSCIEHDPRRHTGLYAKDPAARAADRMLYYRAGSAASAMGPDFLRTGRLPGLLESARLIHTSGITPALSAECFAMTEELLSRRPGEALVSFDVNWRPALWEGREAADLARLADRADVVLVGRDEAEAAFDVHDEHQLRELLPSPRLLVIKDEAVGAVALEADGARTRVPSLTVDVVESVGAGDAFAAGYLAELLRGGDQRRALRSGHLCAAATLTVPTDRGPLPATETAAAALASSEAAWRAVRASAEGLQLPHRPLRPDHEPPRRDGSRS